MNIKINHESNRELRRRIAAVEKQNRAQALQIKELNQDILDIYDALITSGGWIKILAERSNGPNYRKPPQRQGGTAKILQLVIPPPKPQGESDAD